MVTIYFRGGLGNQLFQYAAARTLADKLETDLLGDCSEYSYHRLRTYQLRDFNVRIHELPQQKPALGKLKKYWNRYVLSKVARRSWYYESNAGYQPRWNILSGNINIVGYLQSEGYFAHNRSRLLGDFKVRKEIPSSYKAILDHIKVHESVAVHVRRGDYVSDVKASKIHGVCSKEYYNNALTKIIDRIENPRFFVFSDDMRWTRQSIRWPNKTIFVEVVDASPSIELHAMRECRHHIIANSSFSWWGAWLCENKEQYVVAPRPWFSMDCEKSNSLLPSHWETIER